MAVTTSTPSASNTSNTRMLEQLQLEQKVEEARQKARADTAGALKASIEAGQKLPKDVDQAVAAQQQAADRQAKDKQDLASFVKGMLPRLDKVNQQDRQQLDKWWADLVAARNADDKNQKDVAQAEADRATAQKAFDESKNKAADSTRELARLKGLQKAAEEAATNGDLATAYSNTKEIEDALKALTLQTADELKATLTKQEGAVQSQIDAVYQKKKLLAEGKADLQDKQLSRNQNIQWKDEELRSRPDNPPPPAAGGGGGGPPGGGGGSQSVQQGGGHPVAAAHATTHKP